MEIRATYSTPPRRARLRRFLQLLLGLAIGVSPMVSFAGTDGCTPPAFGTEGFWVSSFGSDELIRFDAYGSPIQTLTGPGLAGPRGVTVTPAGEVYVSSQFGHEILVFDARGAYLRTFTAPGLSGPTGGAIAPGGDFFVGSFNSDDVFRFAPDESLVAVYSSPGLNGPNCIVFRNDGSFWVTGQISNDVHRFDAAGNPVGSFPATGVSSVMGAAFDLEGRLLVAGGASHNVGVFDCDGDLLEHWSVPGGPQSIAVREDGMVFITTFYTDEVLQYFHGSLHQSWVGGDTLRGIEFLPGSLPMFVRGDANRDGQVDIGDPVAILDYLFVGTLHLYCLDAADANDDQDTSLSDAVYLLSFIFQGAAAPPPPFPGEGVDETSDALGCLDPD